MTQKEEEPEIAVPSDQVQMVEAQSVAVPAGQSDVQALNATSMQKTVEVVAPTDLQEGFKFNVDLGANHTVGVIVVSQG